MPGPPCGNNPHFELSPGDRAAVDEFRYFLAARAEEKTTVSQLNDARAALKHFVILPGFTGALERFEAAVRANERAGTKARRLGAPDAAPGTDRARLVSTLDTAFKTFVSPLSDVPAEGVELSDHLADAVLAVLPAPVDQAAVLREAADAAEREATRLYDDWGQKAAGGARAVAELLHRLANEAQPDATTPEPTAPGVVRRRKLPVEVDTIQWTGDNEAQLIDFTNHRFEAVPPEGRVEDPELTAQVFDELHCTWVGVKTGQHIVRGVKGEYYPIAEDVLAETYEPVSGPS